MSKSRGKLSELKVVASVASLKPSLCPPEDLALSLSNALFTAFLVDLYKAFILTDSVDENRMELVGFFCRYSVCNTFK